ncbi:MAG: hypothetical protein HN348_26585 [Proteobacteria bacterium]|jgi:hypothetical protein|nr:hypothetical protein [Pseudomonadota bacterium]
MSKGPKKVQEVLARAARREGLARTNQIAGRERVFSDAPLGPPDLGPKGQVLQLGDDGGVRRFVLDGKILHVGDVVEVFTNSANGWLRGRFEWSGRLNERPCLAINLWNPHGPRDADGLPPWVGEMVAEIPVRALCRRTP